MPSGSKIELGIKEDKSIQDIITLKVYEFPYINVLWIGIIIMVAGLSSASFSVCVHLRAGNFQALKITFRKGYFFLPPA